MHPGVHAATDPDKVAYIMAGTGETVTYRKLDAASNRFAHALRRFGLALRDGIALCLENHPRYYEIVWAAQRSGLYYTTISKTFARTALSLVKLFRRDPRAFGRNKDVDLQASFDAITPITTRIHIAATYRAIADEARRCHASQIQVNPVIEAIGKVAGPLFFREVTLSRVLPPPQSNERIERDLFA